MATYPVYADEPINGNLLLAAFRFLVESAADNMTASGTTQATATIMSNEMNRFTTVTVGSGAQLPPSRPGLTVFVVNHGANPMQVYGSLFGVNGNPLAFGDVIDDQLASVGVSQMANSVVLYTCHTAGVWYTEGLATGFAASLGLQTLTYSTITNNATNTQASGTPIKTQIVAVTNSNNPGSVTLPVSAPGLQITVRNTLATNVTNVFPNAGGTGTETINALAANAAYGMTGIVGTTFNCVVAGQWLTSPVTAS